MLFGVSVYALRPGIDPLEVLGRFPYAPAYVAATVGGAGGRRVWRAPNRGEPGSLRCAATARQVRSLGGRSCRAAQRRAERLLAAAGELRPNPAYAEGADVLSEEE